MANAWLARRNTDRVTTFRRELGLPTDVPVVMTGHQACVWHAGILAKYAACQAAAAALGAAAAWVVVDQDDVDPSKVDLPVLTRGDALKRREAALGAPSPAGVATASAPAIRIRAEQDLAGAPEAAALSVRRIASAMKAHEGEPNAARQTAAALTDLLAPIIAPAPTVFATDLARTTLFRSLLERMLADPTACVLPYNAAARAHADAGITPLQIDADARVELPLWRLRPGRVRQRVFAPDAAAIPPTEFAPRALFMTALLRLAGCDLFIHGTGGGVYDRVTDAWIGSWLNEPLASTAVVSATLLMDLSRPAPPTAHDVARARWRAHHARHVPGSLGLAQEENTRAALVNAVAAARAAGAPAGPAYRALQLHLADYRRSHAEAIERLAADADALAARFAEAGIVNDRTWPFTHHAPEALAGLRDRIISAFASASPA